MGGIRTNLPFHRQVMRHPAFIAGEYDTGFIERHKAELAPRRRRRRDGDAGGGRRGGAGRGRGRGERRATLDLSQDATVGVEARQQGLTAARRRRRVRRTAASKTLLLVAFATLYVVWGSTYLAIRIAVEHWPPLWLAAVRFAIAGGGLYAVLRAARRARARLARLAGGDGGRRADARAAATAPSAGPSSGCRRARRR